LTAAGDTVEIPGLAFSNPPAPLGTE
jgi:hypothetical protein